MNSIMKLSHKKAFEIMLVIGIIFTVFTMGDILRKSSSGDELNLSNLLAIILSLLSVKTSLIGRKLYSR